MCGNNFTVRRHHLKPNLLLTKTPLKSISLGSLTKTKIGKSMCKVKHADEHCSKQQKYKQLNKSSNVGVKTHNSYRINSIQKSSMQPVLKHIDINKEEPQTSQRPTRKTKEAAAIYMEILGHKLVNEDNNDDNISIDSFPELPNVRKTEQRENELKAKANVAVKIKKNKKLLTQRVKQTRSKDIKAKNKDECYKTSRSQTETNTRERISLVGSKRMLIKRSVSNKKLLYLVKSEKAKTCRNIKNKIQNIKNKVPLTSTHNAKADNICNTLYMPNTEMKQESKLRSVESYPKNIKSLRKIKSRNSGFEIKQNINNELEEICNERFIYGNRTSCTTNMCSQMLCRKDNLQKHKQTSKKTVNVEYADNQNSIKTVTLKNKSGQEVRKPSIFSGKAENNFNDSDEEPLSKLTWMNANDVPNKINSRSVGKRAIKSIKKTTLSHRLTKSGLQHIKSTAANTFVNNKKIFVPDVEYNADCGFVKASFQKNEFLKHKTGNVKQDFSVKQSYFTDFSPSDDQKVFHSFVKLDSRNSKDSENKCASLVASADLLRKDVGRRFGKGKVNMSNAQIEKWLKDSAMAGTSLKKENDKMLKFGEKLPAENFVELDIQPISNVDKLKLPVFIHVESENPKRDKIFESKQQLNSLSKNDANLFKVGHEKQVVDKLVNLRKLVSNDRKLIFRKEKQLVPNANAFSASNESSIYAFGEENEDVINTPFRRLSRRPSSTATSRSEDDTSKLEELNKTSGLQPGILFL